MPRTKQTPRRLQRPKIPERPQFQHDEDTAPLTLHYHTKIRTPNRVGEHCALFVLEDVPAKMINEVLAKARLHSDDVDDFWLVDRTLKDIPDWTPIGDGNVVRKDGTAEIPPFPETYTSNFKDNTLEQLFAFLLSTPQSADLEKRYFAVLNPRLYAKRDWLEIHHVDEDGVITSAPCKTEYSGFLFGGYLMHNWRHYLEDWLQDGEPVF